MSEVTAPPAVQARLLELQELDRIGGTGEPVIDL